MRIRLISALWSFIAFGALAAACGSAASAEGDTPAEDRQEYDIVTLLPKDAIRSIDRPEFYSADEADSEYSANEMVLGVVFDGEARAYSVGLLSSHEIVNDVVGGRPIAVTW